MSDAILVLNAGSSSFKYSAFSALPGGRELFRGQLPGNENLEAVFEDCRTRLCEKSLVVVGHRVVHGGVEFAAPVRIDEAVLQKLDALTPLAPLHQPHNLAAIRAVSRVAPHLPQVACFDTAFHRTHPEVAQRFALPRRFHDEGIRRYGFHGLSYEYIAAILPDIDPKAARGRTVIAHLGNGASLCALQNGKSVATTMSFTPSDGLMMGTRSGSLDPGAMIYLMVQHGMNANSLQHLINEESGLLGVSGISSDMRSLLTSNEPAAAEAIELFVYRISRELGSLTAALGGLDALVFTGGIGEHAAAIRSQVCQQAAWLNVGIDENANAGHGPRISSATSSVNVWVLPTNEELMIANHTRQVLRVPEASS
ncbi:acetate/propionate family kinase [soil metagenome]